MTKQQVIISRNFLSELENAVGAQSPESIFILTDDTAARHCLPALQASERLSKARVFVSPSGDAHKNLDTLAQIWTFLGEGGATRKSLLINLGGGMITDMGGFAASTFKRGMRYINLPTTILGAVDAAVGGKTGINFRGLKNEIGVINPAETVLIETAFFRTLDYANRASGMAEILKHALLADANEWNKVSAFDIQKFDFETFKEILRNSIQVKERIVAQDPYEQNIRKALNLGHTVGHAFESLSHEQGKPALHGYAVAWGLVCELYLSHKTLDFPKQILSETVALVKETYGSFPITCDDYEHLFDLMTHDKKNETTEINFTLLADIGDIKINQHVSQKILFEALDFYRET